MNHDQKRRADAGAARRLFSSWRVLPTDTLASAGETASVVALSTDRL